MQSKPIHRSHSLADKLISMMNEDVYEANSSKQPSSSSFLQDSIPSITSGISPIPHTIPSNIGTLDQNKFDESLARFGFNSSSTCNNSNRSATPNNDQNQTHFQPDLINSQRLACLQSSHRLNSSGTIQLPRTPSKSPVRLDNITQGKSRLNASGLSQTAVNTTQLNTSFVNAGGSLIGNPVVMKALEKQFGKRSQQIYFLIGSAQQLQLAHETEQANFSKRASIDRQKLLRIKGDLSKLRQQSEQIDKATESIKKQTAFMSSIFTLDSSQEAIQAFILSSGFAQDTCRRVLIQQVKQKLINVQHTQRINKDDSFSYCEAPFDLVSHSLVSSLKDMESVMISRNGLVIQLIYEIKAAKAASEYATITKEDLQAHVTRRTEMTAEHEDLHEIYGNFKKQYSTTADSFEEMFKLEKEKQILLFQLDQFKINISAQIEVYQIHNVEATSRRNRVATYQATIQEKIAEAKNLAHLSFNFTESLQGFTTANFEQCANQFYNYLFAIFNLYPLLNKLAISVSQPNQDSTGFEQLQLICEFQQLLLEETGQILNISYQRSKNFAEDKARILNDLSQLNQPIDEFQEKAFQTSKSHAQLWLNLRMCVKRGDTKSKQLPDVMRDFLSILSEIAWNNSEFLRIMKEISKIQEEIQAIDIHTTNKQEETLQHIIEGQTKQMTDLANKVDEIQAQLDSLNQDLEKSSMFSNIEQIEIVKVQAKRVFDRIAQLEASRRITLSSLESHRATYTLAANSFQKALTHISHSQQALQELMNVEASLTKTFLIRFKQFNDSIESTNNLFSTTNSSSLNEGIRVETDSNISNISASLIGIKPEKMLGSTFKEYQALISRKSAYSKRIMELSHEIQITEALFASTSSQYEQKIYDLQSKIIAARDALKDQLNKLDFDSSTVFNAFNLNFFDEAHLIRQETQHRLPPLPNSSSSLQNTIHSIKDESDELKLNSATTTARSVPKYGKITIDMNKFVSADDTQSILRSPPPPQHGKENLPSHNNTKLEQSMRSPVHNLELYKLPPTISSSHQKHILAISQITSKPQIRQKAISTYNNNRSRNLSNYNGSSEGEGIPTLNLSSISHVNSNQTASLQRIQNNLSSNNNNMNNHNSSSFFGQDSQQHDQPSTYLDTSVLNNTTIVLPVNTSRQNDSSFIKSQPQTKNLTSPHMKRALSMNGYNSPVPTTAFEKTERIFEVYKMYGGHTRESSIIKRSTFDPLSITADPKAFGYAKRLMRFNKKNGRLEIMKDTSSQSISSSLSSSGSTTSLHSQRPKGDYQQQQQQQQQSQQPKFIIESSYSKEQITGIIISTISMQIIESKKEMEEQKNEILNITRGDLSNTNRLAASKFIPFSIDIDRSGRIQCLATNHEDLVFMQSQFHQI